MRDAIGGVVNLVIIVVFMVIVSGYLAFNVNYTKAFRVKNKIISTYEQYNGNCVSDTSPCMDQIIQFMEQVGYDRNQKLYNVGSSDKDKSVYNCRQGFCSAKIVTAKDPNAVDDREKYYYKIVTQIKIDIPIINRVMQGMDTFRVKGDTKTFISNK